MAVKRAEFEGIAVVHLSEDENEIMIIASGKGWGMNQQAFDIEISEEGLEPKGAIVRIVRKS